MSFTEDYADVLYNIEEQIVTVFRKTPDMTDYMAMRALEAAIEYYTANDRGRPPRIGMLRDTEKEVFQKIVIVCDWQLQISDNPETELLRPLEVKEVLQCLKKILKSAQFWEKQGGRQSYLEYISSMLP